MPGMPLLRHAWLRRNSYQNVSENDGILSWSAGYTSLPEAQIQRSPILLCARVWIMQTHAQHTDLPQLLRTIEHLLAQNDKQASSEDDHLFRLLRALVEIAWSHCYYRTGQAQSSLEHARSAIALATSWRGTVDVLALMYLAFSNPTCWAGKDNRLMELDKGLRSHVQHPVRTRSPPD